MHFEDLNQYRSVEELRAYQAELDARMVELDTEFRGLPMTDEARGEYAECGKLSDEIDERVTELEARTADIARRAKKDGATEKPQHKLRATPDADRDVDIYDLATIRFSEDGDRETRDRAMRAIEGARHLDADQQGHAASLVDRLGPAVARRILMTGSPAYRRAFIKTVVGKALTTEEQRALSVYGSSGDGTEGNLAVPFTLDPTLIATGDMSDNPIRQIANVSQITGNTWQGVAADAVVASYEGEGTPATDGAPTLTQPEIHVEKAQAFIPFSIEIGEDWAGMQADLGMLIAEAKDLLEAEKFLNGAGHGSDEPEGLLTGLSGSEEVPASTSFDITDLYALAGALPRRHKRRASYLGHEAILNLVRGFATAGTNIWAESLQDDQPSRLLGKPVYQCDEMDDTFGSGKKVLIVGNFSRFKIVDRVGLNAEVIPHLFDTSTGYPTGTRGLYVYWRNSSGVLDANAFRVLVYGS